MILDDLSGETIVTAVLATGVVLALCSLIGGLILQLVARQVYTLSVPFREAFITMFLCTVAGIAIDVAIGVVAWLALPEDSTVANAAVWLVSLIAGACAYASIIGARLDVGFRKGLILSIVMLVVSAVLAFLFGLIAFGVITALGGSVSVSR